MIKKIKFTVFFAVLGISVFSWSCSKDESLLNDSSNEVNVKAKTYHIYYAEWSEWGHGVGCAGWGLCDFVDCWFCCTEDGVIVECNTTNNVQRAGTITVDDSTYTGTMSIELNSTYGDQDDAITNEWDLEIDSDIQEEMDDGTTITLIEGTYEFDGTVGSEGGYKVTVTWDDN